MGNRRGRMGDLVSHQLSDSARNLFALGLGAGYVLSILVIVGLHFAAHIWRDSEYGIDSGFLGLIFLLNSIFFLIAFSFLVAASVQGLDIKIAIAAIDALVLIGGKLLTEPFLNYLKSP
jgi:hypothetical protein